MREDSKDTALSVAELRKSFGNITALAGVSLEVEYGELFGLIGPDGAGKTTLIRIALGLIKADYGEVRIFGRNPVKEPIAIKELTGYISQRFSLYPDLTISENIRFFADLYLVPKKVRKRREEELMQFSRLSPFRKRRAGQLSGGMKQKLALCCTLIHTPRLLILDEPTTGVDPVSRAEFWNILYKLKSEGISILITTPYMDEALQCDQVALMHNGKIFASDKPQNITNLFQGILLEITGEDLLSVRKQLINFGISPRFLRYNSNRLHLIAKTEKEETEIKRLISHKWNVQRIKPSLEDAFVFKMNEG